MPRPLSNHGTDRNQQVSTEAMRLILLTFGEKLENHYQAAFSILSFLQSPAVNGITVVTDKPDFYRYFGQKISLLEVGQERLRKWQGQHQFFWRIKIKALEQVQQQHPEDDLLYVDSDTYLVTGLDEMQQGLSAGLTYMHENEGLLHQLPSKTEKRMWQTLGDTQFEGVTIDSTTTMWNAGVVALPSGKAAHTIQLALSLSDAICATRCERRLVEQFSFSLALNHTGTLTAASPFIAHYWGNKPEWNTLIANFFIQAHLQRESLEASITRLRQLHPTAHPTIVKQRNTKRWLQKCLNRLFPPTTTRYF